MARTGCARCGTPAAGPSSRTGRAPSSMVCRTRRSSTPAPIASLHSTRWRTPSPRRYCSRMPETNVARAISAHRAMMQTLEAKVDSPDAASRKDALKTEIISFFKSVEQEIADLNALKDDVKKLVDKWKALQAGATLAPEFAAEMPIVHSDHIGAST